MRRILTAGVWLTILVATSRSRTMAGVGAGPTGVVAAIDNGRVALQWTAVTSAGSYNIYRSTVSGAETLYATGITTTTAYSDGSAANGTKYYYEVSAVLLSLIETNPSSEASATPLGPYSSSEYKLEAGSASAASVYNFTGDSFYSVSSTKNVPSTIDLSAINAPAPSAVYQSERYTSTSFTYTIPALQINATYVVRLHWAELFATTAGSRTMNISINGTQVLGSFDIFASSGAEFRAIAREFVATARSDGTILISIATAGAGNPKIDGIEIYAQPPNVGLSLGAAPTNAGPGTDITYTTTFTNSGAFPSTVNVITLPVANQTCFKVGSINAASTLATSGLTQAVTYSNNGASTFAYTPVSGACGSASTGYDSTVTTVRWTLTGTLSATSASSANTGSVGFAARIK